LTLSTPPSERDETTPDLLRITPEELASARVPPPTQARPPAIPPAAAVSPRGSQLAIGSLVLALLGIPLPGLVLGPIAAVCGAIALSRDDGEGRHGFGLAVAAILLGVVEFVGWGVALGFLLLRPTAVVPGPAPLDLGSDAQLGTADAPPPIQRALRANVRVVCEAPDGGEGSGVVVRRTADSAALLTSRHVVRCAEGSTPGKVRVSDSEGHVAQAEVRWLAPESVDLAVLEVKGLTGIEQIDLRKHPARVGDPIFVVGNPLGLRGSVTTGTVSALRTSSAGERPLRVVQVQASVNPGNSGGGLYTTDGSLLGVVTWMAEKRQGEGLGFAIAIDEVVDLLQARNDVWKEVSDR
jgi:S1-C subfamily serine protease